MAKKQVVGMVQLRMLAAGRKAFSHYLFPLGCRESCTRLSLAPIVSSPDFSAQPFGSRYRLPKKIDVVVCHNCGSRTMVVLAH